MRLCDLTDEQLEAIMNLTQEELNAYLFELISKYYSKVIVGSEQHSDLLQSYTSSILAEHLYRNYPVFQKGFCAIYTKTGLIRNFVNDLYFMENDLIIH